MVFSLFSQSEHYAMDCRLLHINICGSIDVVLGVVSIALQVSPVHGKKIVSRSSF